MKNDNSRLILKPGREYPVNLGHPWIFSGAIAKTVGSPVDGDLVEVYNTQGEYVCSGHYGTRGIALRVLSRTKIESFGSFLESRIFEASKLRDSLQLNATDSYRVVNAEGDGLSGLVVDRYADTVVIEIHSEGMQNASAQIVEVVKKCSSNYAANIVLRNKLSSSAEVLLGDIDRAKSCKIKENELNFIVDTISGQKTGFFLDQRENRNFAKTFFAERKVLNLFCYSGGFSIYALAAGASEVCSIDSSRQALELLARNLEANGFQDKKHESLSADCFSYLTNDCAKNFYETIVLDPPALIKRKADFNAGTRGYFSLNRLALSKISSPGFLFTFSCSQFLTMQDLLEIVAKAASEARRGVKVLKQLGPSTCHPVLPVHSEGNYLKGLLLYVE